MLESSRSVTSIRGVAAAPRQGCQERTETQQPRYNSMLRTKSYIIAAALSLISSTCLTSVFAQTDISRMSGSGQDIKKIVIADGIYQFMTMRDSYVRQLNSVVIVNENDVVVFDTNTRPSSARLILAEIRKITDKPVRYVVNSHWHPDHWSGNEVYARAFPNVEIIATEQTRQYMQTVANEFPSMYRSNLQKDEAEFE